ncbi:ubiquitin carboxyl-terminal hydrolase 10-like isoform X1 [Paramormyrops kingsleyae]|uniref:ubiquitin carboxyl-terminal hydrolase 10-like isoform X1 n=1 Tax=Paramormyrops kingsleyae TaxID=1676925 RepID=UPI003B975AA8
MASHSIQYIFGEFSPDEVNQFFKTPRCYVQLPPFSDKVSCVTKPTGSYCTPVPVITESMRRQVCGGGCDHIKFGVDEVMDAEGIRMGDPACKVSSTLNPQAPEFILGCQPAQNALPTLQGADASDFNLADGSDPLLQSPDDNQPLGSLAQRERKKKKKRPPGYYSYMEGPSGAAKATGAVLVNGHTPVSPDHQPEDMVMEAGLSTECYPGGAEASSGAHSRTSESPDESSSDPTDGAAPSPDHDVVASASCSHSHQLAAAPRTIERQSGPPTLESPELLGSERESPGPSSPLPPGATDEANSTVDGTLDRHAEDCGSPNGEVRPGALQTSLSVPAVSPAPPTSASAANPPKSWASLFHNSKPLPGGPQAFVQVKNVPSPVPAAQVPALASEQVNEVDEGPVHVSEDPLAPRLAELIENVKLIHKPVSLQPRGLINKGNWCYINATLQALVACPPMYHLMKSLPVPNETQRSSSSTPMINSFVRLVNEFSNMPVPSRAKQQAAGDKIMKDIRPGVPFEPNYIYRLLTVIKSSLSEKGRQEDAEEYLGYILNGLHEEMLAVKKLLSPPEEEVSTLNGPESHSRANEETAEKDVESSDDEWEQVGPRNKTSVTRQADFVRTPITDIFGGHIRSVVYQQSSRESATLQPFFTLQLDIQSEKIHTVQEALENLVARESVQGYTTRTKQEIEVSRRVTLEELPPVLVLHLKRFVFEKTGGCQKLVKNVDYPVDLEISKDLLSPGVRSKIFKGQRTYRLFAVVYHHGNSATGGHYTADVFHIGLSGWLRIDDQLVKVISQQQVVKQAAERTAYLLYYRRLDLL